VSSNSSKATHSSPIQLYTVAKGLLNASRYISVLITS
jgi:hypothetical protein